MNKLKNSVILNDKEVSYRDGETILSLAERNGIKIHTLCHDTRLEPFNSCFVCLVNVENAKGFVPACSTKVQSGMKIDTESAEIKYARRMSLNLLASNHNADCYGPCKMACPAMCDVQGYLAHIANGNYSDAIKLIKQTLPIPAVLGRVCPAFCEDACRRNIVDEPISIRALKRVPADKDLYSSKPYIPDCQEYNGKKIAVIGSGPSGLSAAYYLAILGYKPVIYEKNSVAGGMLRYGIPPYRLPRDILDKEIDLLCQTGAGIEIKYNICFGMDISLQDLFKQDYKAIYLAPGTQVSTSLRLDNSDADGIFSGLVFLRSVFENKIESLKGKRVLIIGGGNTAMDAARVSKRIDAESVEIVYRRTRNEMPANDIEIKEAIEEDIKFNFLISPLSIITDANNSVVGLKCIKNKLGETDSSGRSRPVPIEGSETDIRADIVIVAIGQKLEKALYQEFIALNDWNLIKVDEKTSQTDTELIFAGGDAVRGPATVVEAVADGKKAAENIDRFLLTGDCECQNEFISKKPSWQELNPEDYSDYEKMSRKKPDILPADTRQTNFNEIEKIYSDNDAETEASRCMECGCDEVFGCNFKNICSEYNVDQNKYSGEKQNHKSDKTHKFIYRDQEKCIKCGRCVRICSEIIGLDIYGFTNRGFETAAEPPYGLGLGETECESCGACIDGCPTGAIVDKLPLNKPGPFEFKTIIKTCNLCGVGCEIEELYNNDRLIGIKGFEKSDVSKGFTCEIGRYYWWKRYSPKYLIEPIINNDTIKDISRYIRSIDKEKIQLILSDRLDANYYEHIFEFFDGYNFISSIEKKYNSLLSENLLELVKNKDKINFEDYTRFILLGGNIAEDNPVTSYFLKQLKIKYSNIKIERIGNPSYKMDKYIDNFIDIKDYSELQNYIERYINIDKNTLIISNMKNIHIDDIENVQEKIKDNNLNVNDHFYLFTPGNGLIKHYNKIKRNMIADNKIELEVYIGLSYDLDLFSGTLTDNKYIIFDDYITDYIKNAEAVVPIKGI